MNKIATRIHFLMILLLIVFGNNLLKFSIAGLTNIPLILYFGFCLFHIALSSKNNKFKLNNIEKKFFKYLLWIVFTIVLSLFRLYKVFLENVLYFDKSYIIKQSLFLFLIPIAISLYICFINDRKNIESILKKYCFLFFIVINFLAFFGLGGHTVSFFFILLISFYLVKNNNNNIIIKILIMFFTLFYLKNIYSESTALLMLFVYLAMLLFNTKIISFFQKKRKLLYFFIFIIIFFAFYNYSSIVSFLAKFDVNYWWRFSYWINEIRVLKHVFYMGVGFGSTYASADIFDVLKGGFIDPATGNPVNTINALFTTAQHNSYLNVFYRTGLIGGLLFLIYTFDLIFKSKNFIRNTFDSMLFLAFINANLIILFNVGLESPQFIIPYYISAAGLMSLRRVNIE